MTGEGKYIYFDHTADIGVEIRGADEQELLEHGAAALVDLLTDADRVSPSEVIAVHVEGIDREDLLVNWLREVLFQIEVRDFVPREIRAVTVTPNQARGELHGERFDPRRHVRREELKGITRHGVRVTETADGLTARVVIDV